MSDCHLKLLRVNWKTGCVDVRGRHKTLSFINLVVKSVIINKKYFTSENLLTLFNDVTDYN